MPLLRVGIHDDWPTLGWDIVDWVEAYLCHGPGDVEGDKLELDDEQVLFILDCYRIHPRGHARAGQRVVSHAEFSRPKGRAKSELAGALVCVEAMGPARFDGWNAAGKPIGKPVRSPFIRCLATEEDQSSNTYDNVTVMLNHAAEHAPDVFGGIDIGRNTRASTRVYTPGGGEIRPSTAANSSKDGGKESFAVADETHLYILPSLRGMHRTVSKNLRKRKIAEPWMLDTTTMFQPGRKSIAESSWDAGKKISDHRRERAGGFYLNHREGTPVEDWANDEQVLASLEEAFGDGAWWMDLEKILSDEIRSEDATEAESRQFWLNMRTAGAGLYFDPLRWAQLQYASLVVPDDSLIVAGFDGAKFEDATALIATDVVLGHQWVAGLWEKPPNVGEHEWQVPTREVDAAVDDLFDRFDVWRLYADPPYWEDDLARWTGKYGDKRIISWPTFRTRAMVFALRGYRSSQRAGELSHDGDEGFARHIANAHKMATRVKDDKGRLLDSVQKERPGSPNKIDASVAGCLSWEARTDCVAAGMPRTRTQTEAWFL